MKKIIAAGAAVLLAGAVAACGTQTSVTATVPVLTQTVTHTATVSSTPSKAVAPKIKTWQRSLDRAICGDSVKVKTDLARINSDTTYQTRQSDLTQASMDTQSLADDVEFVTLPPAQAHAAAQWEADLNSASNDLLNGAESMGASLKRNAAEFKTDYKAAANDQRSLGVKDCR